MNNVRTGSRVWDMLPLPVRWSTYSFNLLKYTLSPIYSLHFFLSPLNNILLKPKKICRFSGNIEEHLKLVVQETTQRCQRRNKFLYKSLFVGCHLHSNSYNLYTLHVCEVSVASHTTPTAKRQREWLTREAEQTSANETSSFSDVFLSGVFFLWRMPLTCASGRSIKRAPTRNHCCYLY